MHRGSVPNKHDYCVHPKVEPKQTLLLTLSSNENDMLSENTSTSEAVCNTNCDSSHGPRKSAGAL